MHIKTSLLISAALIMSAQSYALAGSKVRDGVSNCSIINCGVKAIDGHVDTDEPFVIQVFADVGECLRLDINKTRGDTTMVVIPPILFGREPADGNVFANDDTGGVEPFSLQSLVKIDPTPSKGFYTVVIGKFDGAGKANFRLSYGRFASGNVNCDDDTDPSPLFD